LFVPVSGLTGSVDKTIDNATRTHPAESDAFSSAAAQAGIGGTGHVGVPRGRDGSAPIPGLSSSSSARPGARSSDSAPTLGRPIDNSRRPGPSSPGDSTPRLPNRVPEFVADSSAPTGRSFLDMRPDSDLDEPSIRITGSPEPMSSPRHSFLDMSDSSAASQGSVGGTDHRLAVPRDTGARTPTPEQTSDKTRRPEPSSTSEITPRPPNSVPRFVDDSSTPTRGQSFLDIDNDLDEPSIRITGSPEPMSSPRHSFLDMSDSSAPSSPAASVRSVRSLPDSFGSSRAQWGSHENLAAFGRNDTAEAGPSTGIRNRQRPASPAFDPQMYADLERFEFPPKEEGKGKEVEGSGKGKEPEEQPFVLSPEEAAKILDLRGYHPSGAAAGPSDVPLPSNVQPSEAEELRPFHDAVQLVTQRKRSLPSPISRILPERWSGPLENLLAKTKVRRRFGFRTSDASAQLLERGLHRRHSEPSTQSASEPVPKPTSQEIEWQRQEDAAARERMAERYRERARAQGLPTLEEALKTPSASSRASTNEKDDTPPSPSRDPAEAPE
jgi:hypothetical protein